MIDPQARLDEMVTKLRDRGHRITPQRMVVLKVLVSNKEHPTVEQIHSRVKEDFPMTSLATVYKTVAVLKEMGEILELGFSGDCKRYDGRYPHPHPHLVCIKCRSLIDLDLDIPVLSELPQEVAQMTGYQILSHQLNFFGICPRCQESE